MTADNDYGQPSVSPKRLTPLVIAASLLATLLIAGALYALQEANSGVIKTATQIGSTPVTIFEADNLPTEATRPVVVISHGFAGSQQLMQPFAVTLAKNGYLAVTFDYYGHGRNNAALVGNIIEVEGATLALLEQTREVVDYALSLPAANGDLVSLGHSMASDIIVRYAGLDERVDATIAVSMFSPSVTASSPKNLLVIVGGLENFLKQEALRVLGLATENPQEAVTVGDFKDGSARRVAFADGVEHVGVLYSSESMREAVNWLNLLYDRSGSGYADNRGLALVALVLGIGLFAWPLSKWLPMVSKPAIGASLPWRQLLPAALIPAIATPVALFWFPADFLGVLVGGYLAVHFLVYGLFTAGCIVWLRRNGYPQPAGDTSYLRLALASIAATVYVAGIIALVLDSYVTSFQITPGRLPLVFLMLAGTLSYFLADEWLTHGAETARGGHLFTRFCFLISLGLAVALSFQELFFLVIIAGVIVIYFLIYGLFSKWIYLATGHPAVGALANAVAFAWALAVVFPMLAG